MGNTTSGDRHALHAAPLMGAAHKVAMHGADLIDLDDSLLLLVDVAQKNPALADAAAVLMAARPTLLAAGARVFKTLDVGGMCAACGKDHGDRSKDDEKKEEEEHRHAAPRRVIWVPLVALQPFLVQHVGGAGQAPALRILLETFPWAALQTAVAQSLYDTMHARYVRKATKLAVLTQELISLHRRYPALVGKSLRVSEDAPESQ